MRRAIVSAITTVLLTALAGTAPASADTATSSNWAGYAAHAAGVSFTKVVGAWREPRASCAAPSRTYSAIWVGLGGFSETSNALEQIGTEVDCSRSGHSVSSAWYELVPRASHTIRLKVHAGDSLLASVAVKGTRVQLALYDLTTHKSFRKVLRTAEIDVTSADWIVEAPSDCYSATNCVTLPLANFGSATFRSAAAQATTGHLGAIADADWGATKIELTPGGRQFVAYAGSGPAAGAAFPSALSTGANSFSVSYATGSAGGNPVFGSNRSVRSSQLLHPGRW